MEQWIRYRGRNDTLREINEIREILIAYGNQSRRFISQGICRRWGGRQPNGVLKEMIYRGLLLQLEVRGLFELPPLKQTPPNPFLTPTRLKAVEVDPSALIGKLKDRRKR